MGQFDTYLRMNIGGAAATLSDFGYSSKPIVKEGKGRTGTATTISAEGWVEGADAAAYGAAFAAAMAGFRISGQNVVVTEWNGAMVVSLLAARCLDGGPHITFEFLPNSDGSALRKRFRLSVEASGKPDENNNDPDNAYTVATGTGPDFLRTVDVKGELTGAGSMPFFTASVLPFFAGKYPSTAWVLNHKVESNVAGDKVPYTISFVELRRPLPATADFSVVDGEATTHVERDEQMRRLTHYTYDFLVIGDPQKVLDLLRPADAGTILRESSETTFHKGQRLRAEFVVLASASGNDLLDWEQSFSIGINYPLVESAEYPGLTPFLVRKPPRPYRYAQSGRAVGVGKFPQAPEPVLPFLSADPSVVRKHLSDFEKETSWEYQYVSIEKSTFDPAKLARPAKPTFYT